MHTDGHFTADDMNFAFFLGMFILLGLQGLLSLFVSFVKWLTSKIPQR